MDTKAGNHCIASSENADTSRGHVSCHNRAGFRQTLENPQDFRSLDKKALIACVHFEEMLVGVRELIWANGGCRCPNDRHLEHRDQGWCLPHSTLSQHFEKRAARLGT